VSSANPKKDLLTQFAAVARAIGNPHRLDLLEHLAQADRTVEGLSARTGIAFASASQHLQALRRVGLVEAHRDGRHVVYRLADDCVVALIESLRRVAERRVAAVDRIVNGYFKDRDGLEPVSQNELLKRMRDGVVTVVDVRPEDEFNNGHIAGAINMPLAQLKRKARALPKNREIVAYCRGPWCVLAFEAVAVLRRQGRAARRLDGGLPEWRLAGLPLS
jgi:ArsR family transcriptional regulator